MKTISNICVAFGTIILAIVAIWGDYFRSKLAPPKLRIVPFNTRGTITQFTNGPRVIYYHMKVVNDRPWFMAKNCQVRLTGISLIGPNNQPIPMPNPVPQTFVWSPAGLIPATTNIAREQIFDFGRVAEGAQEFEPVLYFYPNNFQGRVGAGQTVRYTLEVVGENLLKSHIQVFEAAWTGQWYDNLDRMSLNLTITPITAPQA
jgi:hypothetical protein